MPDGAPAMFSQKSGFTEISKQEPGVFLIASFHRMRHIENICAHFQKQTLWKVLWTRPLKLLCVSHRFMERNGEREGGALCVRPRSAVESQKGFPRFTLLSIPIQGFWKQKEFLPTV